MTKTKKRALELMYNGYHHAGSRQLIYPKWHQAYAIALAEERRFARKVADRLLGVQPNKEETWEPTWGGPNYK